MATLAPADSTEANVAITMQSFGGVGTKSSVSSSEANVAVTALSLSTGTGVKSSVVLVDGLIDYSTINPEDSYQIVDD